MKDRELQILAVCAHEGIRATILRLLHSHSPLWQATGAATADEAIAIGEDIRFNVVLLGNGLSEADEQKISSAFKARDEQVKLIRHYGGGSGLLFGEIYEALSR